MNLVELTKENYSSLVSEAALPIVIEFYSKDCDVCKLLTPLCEKVSKEYEGRANWAKCDIYVNSEIARKYNIKVASQIAVVYKEKSLGVFGGAHVSAKGKGAVKEEWLKERVNKCLESLVKQP